MSAKGGITKGKSHKEGGIPMVVKSTGQQVELEGGEGVINKRNMSSEKKFEFEGEEKTICEIASEINSADGNGVQIDCDNVTGKKYEYAKGGKILDEDQEQSFKEWMDDGNVIEFEKGIYSTQDAQYSNRLKGMDELRKYYRKEFLSDSYEGGGWIQRPIKIKKDVYQFKDQNGVGYIVKRGVGERITPMWIVSNDEEGTWDGSHNPFYTKKSAEKYIESFFAKGGSIDVETYDYNQLIGKYVNIHSMGVELPSEHKVEGVMFSSPQFRYRQLTLKFDRGIAPIEIEDIPKFLNNDIVFVNDNKEDFGVQLIPNQFAKGGDVRNMSWFQDFKKQELKRGTEHEMEHIDTIREFKKEGVSDREVAEAIAKDHLDEDENYYIELSEMEKESKNLGDTLNEYEKNKSHRKNAHKYAQGGYMGDARVKVHLMFTEDFTGILRKPNGSYLTESFFPKNKVSTFNFIHNDGRTTALEFSNTGAYMLVPSDIINVVGFDEQFANGGSVSPYQSVATDDNDKLILNKLRTIDDIYSVTSKEKQLLSSFKGDNVVNQLSNAMIQKIYSVLFKYHNIEHPIKNLYLSNIGVGNILLFAPNYIDHTICSYDKDNRFSEIEEEISSIVTLGKRASILTSEVELHNIDAIIHVYAQTNPISDSLVPLLFKINKTGGTALGVAEFTSREKLNQFQKTIAQNQGGMGLNQMMMFKKSNDYLIVNEGITEEGNYTLMYVMNKM